MPYELRQQGDKYCVFNKDTGESKGCSATRDEAVKHMRLLYGVESGSIKKEYIDEFEKELDCVCDSCIANSVGIDDSEQDLFTKAAWTSSYISSLPDSSFAYIEPDCSDKGCRHFPIKDANGSYDAAHVRNALARAPQSPFGSKAMPKIQAGARALGIGDDSKDVDTSTNTNTNTNTSLVDRVKAWLSGNEINNNIPEIYCTKQAVDGRTRVFMRMSNVFKDRHGEIITSHAHKEYEAYVAGSKDYPEFWLWHTPGSKWGRADLVDFSDGFLTVSGLVDEGKEYIAESLATQKDIGVSHGFRGLSLHGKGYIDFYRTFEVSPLPLSEAANVWTAYMIAKSWESNGMGLQDKHKKFFEGLHVPAEIIDSWDKSSKDLSAILKEAGIDYKEVEEAIDGTKQSAAVHRAMAAFHTQAAGDTEDKNEAPEKPGEKPDAEDKREGREKEFESLSSKMDALTTAVGTLAESQKALDAKLKDAVGDTLAAAIVPGAGTGGYVASKEGGPPSDSEVKQTDDWLLDLIAGGTH